MKKLKTGLFFIFNDFAFDLHSFGNFPTMGQINVCLILSYLDNIYIVSYYASCRKYKKTKPLRNSRQIHYIFCLCNINQSEMRAFT